MAVTRIKNNQITDATINAAAKLADTSVTAGKLEDNLTYGSNLTITGNLTVNGATTTVSTTNTTVEDTIMILNSDASGSNATDIGIYGERGTDASVFMGWDESADQFALVETSSAGTDTTMTITDYAPLRLGALTADDTIDATGNITGGNLTTAGDVTTATVTATGNIDGGNLITSGLVDATGNITGGNLITGGLVDATGNVTGGNLTTAGDVTTATVTATGNIDGGNLITGGLVDATGSITAGTTIDATGNITGGNLITGGLVDATGNIDGANFNTGGLVSATGNITGGNLVTGGVADVTGNITGGNIITGGLVDATGNVSGGNLVSAADVTTVTVTATGNVSGGNLTTAGVVDATGNVIGGNLVTAGVADVTGNITGGNIITGGLVDATGSITAGTTIDATGNITGGNIITGGLVDATGNVTGGNLTTAGVVDATGNITGGNLITTGLTETGDLTVLASGTVEMNQNVVGNIGTPVANADAATKAYVDSQVSAGFDITDGTTTQNITSGDTLTFSGTTDEIEVTVSATDTVTIGLPDDVVIGNDLTVTGNLTVDGTTTTVNSVTSTLQDPIFQLGRGADDAPLTSDDAKDRGISMYYYEGSEKVSFMGFETTDNKFIFIPDATIAGEVVSGAAGAAEFGAVDVTSLDSTGNVAGGNLTTAGVVDATGNITGGNIITGGLVDATGNIDGANFNTSGLVSATGNVSGGNLVSAADVTTVTVTATGNIDGGNLITGGLVDATGSITAGTTIDATGNITGGNILTSGLTQTGDLTVLASGTIEMNQNVVGNVGTPVANADAATKGYVDGLLSAGFDVTDGTTTQTISQGDTLTFSGTTNEVEVTVSATDTITVGLPDDVTLGGGLTATTTVSATGNVTGGNIITGGLVDATGSITAGTTIDATGNVTGGNLVTAGTITDGTATISGGDGAGFTSMTIDNLSLDGNDITATSGGEVTINEAGADVDFRVESDNNANMLFVDAGTDSVNIGTGTPTTDVSFKVGTADAMMPPIGNTAQRPASGVVGMLRFSTTSDSLEQYTSADGWETVGVPAFTVIASETFDGDNSTVAFTLSDSQTTASCIVSINGVVQLPTTAYGVSGTTLTFTEAPLSGDKIEVRKITTTTTVTNISSASGGATVEANNETEIDVKGNLMPAADSTYSIGNATTRWTDIYVDAGSIHLGNIVLKESSGELALFASDGTTPADITADSLGAVSADAITNGTSNVSVAANSSVTVTVAGSTAATFAAGGLTVAGNLTVSGTTTTVNSTTLDVADKNITIADGAADSSAADGAGITVDGAGATFTYTHSGTKWNMNKDLDLGSNNFITSGEFQGTATSAQYADLAEKYEADADYEPGTVVHFGGEKEVSQCDMDHCTKVAGVVSTSPAYRMNDGLEAEHVAMVALTGRVPCKVQGPVAKGDMMVSAGNGKARAEADPKVGAVIGKALEDFNGEEGVIEVVVGKH